MRPQSRNFGRCHAVEYELRSDFMMSVLVVDDHADSREVVAAYLRRMGHVVQCTSTGKEALDSLGEQMPDVIVLDQHMPEMDGMTFLEVIRSYLRWQSLPVVLLTGYDTGSHIKNATALGVKKIFLKSDYELAELAEWVEACARPVPAADCPPNPPASRFN